MQYLFAGNVFLLFSVTIGLLGPFFVPVNHIAEKHVEPTNQHLLADAKTPDIAARMIGDILNQKPDKLEKYSIHVDTSVALFMSWKSLEGARQHSKTKDEVARFIGRCEAILGIPCPQSWIDSLYRGEKGWKYFPSNLTVEYKDIGRGLRTRKPSIELQNSALRLKSDDGKLMTIPIDKLDVPTSESIDFIQIENSTDVIIAYPSTISSQYKIIKFDTKKEQVVWESKVWSSNIIASTGTNHHYVDLVIARNTVVLFGSNVYSVYVEAFALDNGRPSIRFNSRGW